MPKLDYIWDILGNTVTKRIHHEYTQDGVGLKRKVTLIFVLEILRYNSFNIIDLQRHNTTYSLQCAAQGAQ